MKHLIRKCDAKTGHFFHSVAYKRESQWIKDTHKSTGKTALIKRKMLLTFRNRMFFH